MNNFKLTCLKIIFISFFITLVISCPNDQMRDLVELKVSDPVADTFIINSGAPTSSRTVTLNSDVSKEEDALEMRFKNDGGIWSDWESYSPAKTWTLPIGDGVKTVYAEYRDEGHHVVSMTNNITLDTGAPVGPGFYVWGSGTETGQIHDFINTAACTLFMNVAGADRMRFSNTSVGSSIAEWDAVASTVSYADSYSWTLSSGDGSKTVYSQFLDAADNDSYFSYTITLDETLPSVTDFQINNGDAFATAIGTTLSYDYTEANDVWAEYRNDGGSWSARESLSGGSVSKSWILRSEAGTRTVYLRLKDIAGNLSSTYSDDIYLSTAAPEAPVPSTATPTNDTTPTWTWSAVAGAVNYRYYFPDYPIIELGNVTSFTPSTPLYTNQDHTFYLQASDIAGNWSEEGSHTVTIDTIAPSAPGTPFCTQASDGYINSSEISGVIITVDFSSSGAVEGDSLDLYINSSPSTGKVLNSTDISNGYCSFSVSSAQLGSDGTKTVEAEIEDLAGNSSPFSSSLVFTLDTAAPSIAYNSTPSTPSTDTTPTWSWTASDSGSGVEEYRYIFDSGSQTSTVLSSYTAPAQSDGTHTFSVMAVDYAGNTSSWTSTSTIVINALPPTAGSGLTYTSSTLWGYGVQLTWSAASDTVTPQSSLQYTLVRSSSSNINTVANAQSNGTTVMNWTANTTSYTVNNLSPSSTYYFNVIVRDSLNNMSVYSTETVTTPVRPLLLIETTSIYNGNLGGRTGADAKVQAVYAASYSGFNCSNVRCLISVSDSDEIRDMPALYGVPTDVPVYSPNGTKIANNWSQLMYGGGASNLLSSLNDAGLSDGTYGWWWSGSFGDGSLGWQHCNGYTDTTGGTAGSSSSTIINETTGNWLWSSSVAGTQTCKLLGVCW